MTGGRLLRISWAYPDVLGLYGDRGNVWALQRVAAQAGIETRVTRVSALADDIDYGDTDLVVLGPGELRSVPALVKAMERERGPLADYALHGGAIFATGTTGALLGRTTTRTDGGEVSGLGLLDIAFTERAAPYGDDLLLRVDGVGEVVAGSQIRLLDAELGPRTAPFGRLDYGLGNSGREGDDAEGARSQGVVWTNALGPVLVKNPWLAAWLIELALGEPVSVPGDSWDLERRSLAAVTRFTENKPR